jgi:cytidylate kinase
MSIIAISRGTFSGGEAVAMGLAERLGYRCISREVILDAAWKYKLSEEELAAAMEKVPPLWERMAGPRATHLVYVQAALCKYAQEDNLVFHGYLGHLLLPGISHVLSVRVIADSEFRIKAVMERHPRLSRKEAIARCEKLDRDRRQWTRSMFHVDWDDAGLYDLVLNLSRMSVATACHTVMRLAEHEEFRPTAASLKAVRDLALQSQVLAALASDDRTQGADLEVRADAGIVIVKGTTQSPVILEAAAAVARRVPGVKDVKSEVKFLLEGRSDAER